MLLQHCHLLAVWFPSTTKTGFISQIWVSQHIPLMSSLRPSCTAPSAHHTPVSASSHQNGFHISNLNRVWEISDLKSHFALLISLNRLKPLKSHIPFRTSHEWEAKDLVRIQLKLWLRVQAWNNHKQKGKAYLWHKVLSWRGQQQSGKHDDRVVRWSSQ